MGFGTFSPASRIRMPRPPQNRTTFIDASSCIVADRVRSNGHRTLPSQRGIEAAIAEQLLDSRQPHIARKHPGRQSVLDEVRVKLFGTPTNGPFSAEVGNMLCQLLATHPIASWI